MICRRKRSKSPAQKAMNVSYFAEIKGLVGCECGRFVAFKVRGRKRPRKRYLHVKLI